MLKTELKNEILRLLVQGKKIKEIAKLLGRHPNTISKYANWLRKHQVQENPMIINKIDNLLDERLLKMKTTELIAYRRILTPQRVEQKTELGGEVKYVVDWGVGDKDPKEFT